jgi:competence ComEA-like helix-hairpin-helix protein
MFPRPKTSTALLLVLTLALARRRLPAVRGAVRCTESRGFEARPIDINTADSAALESVPGIGKSLSQRILAFREKNGVPSVDDLLKVPGVGEKSIQKLRPT